MNRILIILDRGCKPLPQVLYDVKGWFGDISPNFRIRAASGIVHPCNNYEAMTQTLSEFHNVDFA
jgi:hypothetical protein